MIDSRQLRKFLWGYTVTNRYFDMVTNWTFQLLSVSALAGGYMTYYLNRLILPFASLTSIIGFILFTVIIIQLMSGFFLAWYFVPEPGLVVDYREEMFDDVRFGWEIFMIHVRGVDTIMIFSYFHIFKKIYLKNYVTSESDGWLLGGYAFFWFHYIVGLGITLSASHLSDLTLTIAANVAWSFFNNIHKTYYIIFTNKHLNTDQLVRLMVFHYITPVYYLTLINLHVLFCHESWDTDSGEWTYEDRSTTYIAWFYDALQKEFQDACYWSIYVFLFATFHNMHLVCVSYYFFERWNIAEMTDIRFYGVAPHWYFRAFMGILVVSPTHWEGLIWVISYLVLLAALPIVFNFYHSFSKALFLTGTAYSYKQTLFYILFLLSLICTTSMLPCGRYYYEPEAGYKGNPWVKVSYQYVYFYLGWLLHHVDKIDQHVYRYSYWQLRKSESSVSDYLRTRKRQTLVSSGKETRSTFEQKFDSYLMGFTEVLSVLPRQLVTVVLDTAKLLWSSVYTSYSTRNNNK